MLVCKPIQENELIKRMTIFKKNLLESKTQTRKCDASYKAVVMFFEAKVTLEKKKLECI